ncbi:MAG: efflux RND transporter periplasmic adaptor subunit [Burkholderiales bacterium]|nr:efflux RND transporter periplasmic adaptor subunit [Burkholderiales bacterium]
MTPQEQKEAGIQVQAAAEADVAATVTLNGTLVPNQDRIANVLPRLAGRIVSAPVPLGATVRVGQTLAVLESIDLGDAQSSYRQARSDATVADAALERAQKLAAEDIIAQKDLQRARGDAERARAALRAAADKLRLLGVAPAPLEHQRDAIYPVVAPLAGTVIEKHAVPGALAETDPLFVVADLSTVWLEADVFEKDLALLKTGSPATVSVAAYPDRPFQGRLTYVSSTMDTASRTVKARIEVPNTDTVLKPGMFATARITSSATVRALVLPAQAVTLMNDKPSVFVLTPKGFEARSVETASRPDGTVEVRAGLNPGDKVAVAGAYALKSRVLKSSLAKDD